MRVATLADAPELGRLAAQTLARTREFIPEAVDVQGRPAGWSTFKGWLNDATVVCVVADDLSYFGLAKVRVATKVWEIMYIVPETITLVTARSILKALLQETMLRFPSFPRAQLVNWSGLCRVEKQFASERNNAMAFITNLSLQSTDDGQTIRMSCNMDALATRLGL